ncbi:universal stress protein [Streptomyces sp. NPDC059696]|uniref:universal stress protein n=1 Tax=Streptomyces sp. NPDC059696 TaxID=3346911 RepID=UPI0036B8537A
MVHGLVIVGVDGSASGLAAAEAAAREASSRGAGLRVVHALTMPAPLVASGVPAPGPPEAELRRAARLTVAQAVARARTVAPHIAVSHVVIAAEPLTVLEAQSRSADLVVVGSRGMGGFIGLLAGSKAVHLAAHGSCPVLVVREPPRGDGPVVLGVDGSAAGRHAVGFAFAEAAWRNAPLLAVHCWTAWSGTSPSQEVAPPSANPSEALAERAERLLSTTLAEARERHRDVTVRREVVHGGSREALIEASRSAQLLVVGARGRGGFAGLLLGSVSQAVLHHAHCPVAVVRGERRREA